MDYEFFRTHIADRVGWLEQNRPPRNAYNWEMLRELPVVLDDLITDDGVRVIVFASALERYFAVGADIPTFDGIGADGMRDWVALCHDVAHQMRGAPKPLLAALHGTAVGGGVELSLHCDIRFAARDARLGQPEIAIAFIPPVGATQALARLLGRPAALKLLYDGALLSAEEARVIGLVDVVCEPAELRAEVQDYAAGLAAKPAGTLAAIRRCINIGGSSTFDDGLAIERDAAVRLAGSDDFREGVRAFLAKRSPVWQ